MLWKWPLKKRCIVYNENHKRKSDDAFVQHSCKLHTHTLTSICIDRTKLVNLLWCWTHDVKKNHSMRCENSVASDSMKHKRSVKFSRKSTHTHTHVVRIQITFHLIKCQLQWQPFNRTSPHRKQHSTVIVRSWKVFVFFSFIPFSSRVSCCGIIKCDFSFDADRLGHLSIQDWHFALEKNSAYTIESK